MKLIAYVIDDTAMEIRPAPLERAWMDATDQRFAYRCLPLNIANAHGWEVLCPAAFKAIWSGEKAIGAIKIEPEQGALAPAISHFGSGILTFHLPFLFRTESGFDLLAQGPINRPKDAIAPLAGIIETDWAPYTFTMNWIFTQPEIEIEFEKGEPFCHLFPVRRGELEAVEPELRPLSSDAALEAEFRAWSASRNTFNQELRTPESKAQSERWQKHYYKGVDLRGEAVGPRDHRTRLRLKDFKK